MLKWVCTQTKGKTLIPTTINDSKLTGSLGGQVTNMTVDLSNLSHIMNVLTDLYEDGELAVIREYSTNARDSHVMSNKGDVPIEVFLPTPLRQTFEIQDFGLGMSPSDITDTYGSYGASSKRETNDANGCLGLGSKSALTYTNMFTVRAVKDGVLTEVAIYRDDRGAGSIEVIDTKATDASNGVRIIVPTHANSEFERKALDFYSTWEPGTVKVHGHEISHVTKREGAFNIDEKTVIVPVKNAYRSDRGNMFVVMGGVTYPVTRDPYNNWSYAANYNVYYFADMQPEPEIDFTPSRESLNMTPRTAKVVDDVRNRANKEAVTDFVTGQIAKAKSLPKAVEVWNVYRGLRSDFLVPSYKGITLIDTYNFGECVKVFRTNAVDRSSMVTNMISVAVKDAANYLFVDKPVDKPFTFKAKAALRQIVADNGYNENVIMTAKPKHPLMRKAHSITWKQVLDTDVKVEYAKRNTTESKYYWVLGDDNAYYQRSLPNQGFKEIVYQVGRGNYTNPEWLKNNPKTLFVTMQDRRVNKFVRENPKAISVGDWMKRAANKLPNLTADEILWSSESRWNIRAMRVVKNAGYTDPKIDKILAIDDDKNRTERIAKVRQQWYNYGRSLPSEDSHWDTTYPLVDLNRVEHTLIYMNALKSAGKV